MKRTSRMGAVALAWLGASVAWAAQPAPAEPMLAAHNRVRSVHALAPLAWSPLLAADAGRWADRLAAGDCRMQHDPANRTQGENLYWASPVRWSDGRRERQRITPELVVESWAAERAHYDHAGNTCRSGEACGHYTQVVWRDTTHVGCAVGFCPDQGQIWVCRYSPAGNRIGERPY